MNTENKRKETLLNILKTMEFDYIDTDKYNRIAEIFFAKDKNEISIFSSIDVGGQPKRKDSLEAVDDYFFVINSSTKEIENKTESQNSNNSKDSDGIKELEIIKNKTESQNSNNSKDSDEIKELEIIKNKIFEKIDELGKGLEFKTITIIRVYNSIERKYQELKNNEPKFLRKQIQEKIQDNHVNKSFSRRDINYESYFIPNDIDEDSIIKIDIEDRVRSLEQEYMYDKIKIKGYVFTASVDSIINLYNIFGDKLFDRNVRIGGVTDYTGVDDAIKYTYCKTPQEFWFYNNGISLLIESKKDLDIGVFNCIKFSVKDLGDISVINGAQTIRAVSIAKSENQNLDKWISPNVLLRIYFYNSTLKKQQDECNKDTTNCKQKDYSLNNPDLSRMFREFSEKVTISLNKQKPIKQADLAYMTDFVKNIQELKGYSSEESKRNKESDSDKVNKQKDKLKDFIFEFVRRGEQSSVCSRQYQLDIFAKIVRSYLQKKPGTSRSKSYASLLKLEQSKADENDTMKTIPRLEEYGTFVSGLQKPWNDNINDFADIFLKNYSPVNFAMSLKSYLEDKDTQANSKTNFEKIKDEYCDGKNLKKEDDEALKSFVNYGILFMVTAVIHSINEGSEDFSGWKYTKLSFNENLNKDSRELPITELKNIINKILTKFLDIKKDINEDINDSNYWKKDDLIEKLLENNNNTN